MVFLGWTMRTNVWTMPLAMPQPGTFAMTLTISAAALRAAAARQPVRLSGVPPVPYVACVTLTCVTAC